MRMQSYIKGRVRVRTFTGNTHTHTHTQASPNTQQFSQRIHKMTRHVRDIFHHEILIPRRTNGTRDDVHVYVIKLHKFKRWPSSNTIAY